MAKLDNYLDIFDLFGIPLGERKPDETSRILLAASAGG